MKILITGGAGFIGSHLADLLLKKKHSVLVFDNMKWGKKEFIEHNLSNPNYKLEQLDLLDEKTLSKKLPKDIDIVFHLAANSNIQLSGNDPGIDLQNTTIATFNLLNAMKQNGVKKIFYFSGSGVYGDVGTLKTKESFGPLMPISMYGATKLSAEAMISAYVHLFDMQGWILRPANIIGPRATHGVVFDFVNQVKSNPKQFTILGDGTQSKSYLYITDVLDAVEIVWKKSKHPLQIFNLASSSYVSVNEIAEIVMQKMEVKLPIHRTGGKRGWKGDVPVVRLNNTAIQKLGWKSKHTSKQAVVKTVLSLL